MAPAGKVLIIIEDGSFTFDNRVKREVKTLASAGLQVSVICPRDAGERWARKVGSTHVYGYPRLPVGGRLLGHVLEYAWALASSFLLALWVAVRRGFDVIHLANPPDALLPIALFFKLLGKRYVFDHHDLCPELFQARFGQRSRWMHALLLWAERQSLSWADGVLSPNESYRRVAIERGQVAPELVTVVRNGPDLERFRDWAPPCRKESIRAGYLGNMNPQDGVEALLQAAKHICTDHGRTDIDFVLIGSGDSLPALKRLAAELGLEGRLRFTGRISDEEALAELRAIDIGCQPDPPNPFNAASTMNKALEYMALAKPVVAFDLLETRVSCGEAALYAAAGSPAELAGAILKLADDFELRRALGLSGRRRIEERLAWVYSEAPLIDAYRHVLGGAPWRQVSVEKCPI